MCFGDIQKGNIHLLWVIGNIHPQSRMLWDWKSSQLLHGLTFVNQIRFLDFPQIIFLFFSNFDEKFTDIFFHGSKSFLNCLSILKKIVYFVRKNSFFGPKPINLFGKVKKNFFFSQPSFFAILNIFWTFYSSWRIFFIILRRFWTINT